MAKRDAAAIREKFEEFVAFCKTTSAEIRSATVSMKDDK
jgi:hypothetical protein